MIACDNKHTNYGIGSFLDNAKLVSGTHFAKTEDQWFNFIFWFWVFSEKFHFRPNKFKMLHLKMGQM